MALAEAGVAVVINGRDGSRVRQTAEEIRDRYRVRVTAVVADVSSEEGRAALLAAAPAPDMLINNNGGPPPAPFDALSVAGIEAGLAANLIAPVRLIQAVLVGMVERGFGRIVNITSASVKAPLPGLDLSSGARAGLTGFVAGVARTVAHANVTINNLLPGAFDTDRITNMTAEASRRTGTSVEDLMRRRTTAIPAGRLGRPEEFGATCAFLCSDHAGYITGQNLLLDGGAYPGIM
jgi:3-oxoacyl-[acyl-carrier protein] reductase